MLLLFLGVAVMFTSLDYRVLTPGGLAAALALRRHQACIPMDDFPLYHSCY